jgi:hypothetical protein
MWFGSHTRLDGSKRNKYYDCDYTAHIFKIRHYYHTRKDSLVQNHLNHN